MYTVYWGTAVILWQQQKKHSITFYDSLQVSFVFHTSRVTFQHVPNFQEVKWSSLSVLGSHGCLCWRVQPLCCVEVPIEVRCRQKMREALGCYRKLGSMVCKWLTTCNLLLTGVNCGYNPLTNLLLAPWDILAGSWLGEIGHSEKKNSPNFWRMLVGRRPLCLCESYHAEGLLWIKRRVH